jgi:hypothetical protein
MCWATRNLSTWETGFSATSGYNSKLALIDFLKAV